MKEFYTLENYIIFCENVGLNKNNLRSLKWFKEYCKGLCVIYNKG